MELLGHFHSLLFSAKHSNYDLKPIAAFSAGGRAANMEYLNITALLQGFQFWIQTTEKNPTKHIISQYAERQYLVFSMCTLTKAQQWQGGGDFWNLHFQNMDLVSCLSWDLGREPGLASSWPPSMPPSLPCSGSRCRIWVVSWSRLNYWLFIEDFFIVDFE